MENSERLKKMRRLAYRLSNDLINEKYAIGVLLYGSVVSGKIHGKSDIDIATIYDGDGDAYPLHEEKVLESIKLDIYRYPISSFIHTFEDDQYRGKTDSWTKTSLNVQLMRSCEIIKDPQSKLNEWKAKANEWSWRENEIKPLMDRSYDAMFLLKEVLAKKEEFNTLLCLRDIIALLVCICLMKHDLIPAWTPKDPLSTLLPLKKKRHREFVDFYILVNGLDEVNLASFPELLDELDKMIKQECGREETLALESYENARICLMKGEIYGAVLSARNSGQLLGLHILKKRGIRLELNWPDPYVHLEMVNECRAVVPFFNDWYKRIHDYTKYNLRILNRLAREIEGIKKEIEE